MNIPERAGRSLEGELATRLHRAYDHLLKIPRDRITRDLREHGCVRNRGADYAGRWIGATAQAARVLRADNSLTRDVARQMIALQHEDGHFGFPGDDAFWFGLGRGLVGLMEYFEATGDEPAYDAAVRTAAYCAADMPLETSDRHATVVQGLAMLMNHSPVTCDRYLPLVERLMLSTTAYRQPESPSSHSHTYLLCARGMLALHDLTGDDRYLRHVKQVHQTVARRHAWISGGLPELFDSLADTDETCATADWFRLNLDLSRITGDDDYWRMAERILANHLYFSQSSNGGFTARRDLEGYQSGEVRDYCCSMHGTRALVAAADAGMDPTAYLDESRAMSWRVEPVGDGHAIFCGAVLYVRLAERGSPLLAPQDPQDVIVQGTRRGQVNASLVDGTGREVWCSLFPLRDLAPEVVTVHIGDTAPCRAKRVQYLFRAYQ